MKTNRVKEKVTPKMAQEFLDSRSHIQRNTPMRHITEIADAMENGRWMYNGESIKFDTEGSMIDGQHRCLACIKANKSFITDIVYGLQSEVYVTIDLKGKPRSIGDVLRMDGEIKATTLASGMAWMIALKGGFVTETGKKAFLSPDAQQVQSELSKNPEMRESVTKAQRCSHIFAASPLSALHYLFSRKDPELADEFLVQLATGEGLSSSNPILFLRSKLLNDKIYNKAKLPMGDKVASIVKSWNILRNGKIAKNASSIRWSCRGKNKEKFPAIK